MCKKGKCSRTLWRGRSGAFHHFMSKILHFGRSCKAYLRMYSDRSPDVVLCCEDCGCRLHKHGRYMRSVATKSEIVLIPIYRQICPSCGKTVSLLPDFLVPWARFATWVREAAMTRRQSGFTWRQMAESTTAPAVRCSHRTLKRWWQQYLQRAAFAALWVASELVSLGFDGDLLRSYPSKIAPKPADTLEWLKQLLSVYIPAGSWRRGYWTLLNTRLPVPARL